MIGILSIRKKAAPSGSAVGIPSEPLEKPVVISQLGAAPRGNGQAPINHRAFIYQQHKTASGGCPPALINALFLQTGS